MTTGNVIVVERHDRTTNQTVHRFLIAPEALAAAREWIARNRTLLPSSNEIGMVMPEFVIYITDEGDLHAPTTEVLEIYGEIDSHGTIAIPREEIAAFMRIVDEWGVSSADATDRR